MSLPKIDYPIYTIKIPSTDKNCKFRPFLVKEEKLLLMAKESSESSDILIAIKQVVNNCCLEKNFDVNKLAIFDLEYVFIKLRSLSVDNVVKLSYKDTEDEKDYSFDVDLSKIEVVFPKNVDNNIKITDKSGILMKYPSANLYDDKEFLNLEKDYLFELIIRCMDKIYLEDNIYEIKDYSKKDLEEFLDGLSLKTFEQINNFLTNTPKLEYVINYKNSLEHDRKVVLNSLNDFFMFR
jgi:hypothetical protein